MPDGRPAAVADLARWLRHELFRGLAVIVGGLEPAEREEVFHFCQALGAPVVADAASGLREALGRLSLPDGDRLLAWRKPGKILRLGEVPSGRFWRDLEQFPEIAVWSVCRNGLPGLAREVLRMMSLRLRIAETSLRVRRMKCCPSMSWRSAE